MSIASLCVRRHVTGDGRANFVHAAALPSSRLRIPAIGPAGWRLPR